ncbi:hypothetical protein [Flavobacterium sp.]|nr:hypothetical protein [Flavobacterium sp.]
MIHIKPILVARNIVNPSHHQLQQLHPVEEKVMNSSTFFEGKSLK